MTRSLASPETWRLSDNVTNALVISETWVTVLRAAWASENWLLRASMCAVSTRNKWRVARCHATHHRDPVAISIHFSLSAATAQRRAWQSALVATRLNADQHRFTTVCMMTLRSGRLANLVADSADYIRKTLRYGFSSTRSFAINSTIHPATRTICRANYIWAIRRLCIHQQAIMYHELLVCCSHPGTFSAYFHLLC